MEPSILFLLVLDVDADACNRGGFQKLFHDRLRAAAEVRQIDELLGAHLQTSPLAKPASVWGVLLRGTIAAILKGLDDEKSSSSRLTNFTSSSFI
jgi:hypothetical protein